MNRENIFTLKNASNRFFDVELYSDGSACIEIGKAGLKKDGSPKASELFWFEPEDIEALMNFLQGRIQEELS